MTAPSDPIPTAEAELAAALERAGLVPGPSSFPAMAAAFDTRRQRASAVHAALDASEGETSA